MKKIVLLYLVVTLFILGGCSQANIDDKEPDNENPINDKDPDNKDPDNEEPIVKDPYQVYTIYLTTENNQEITSKETYLKGTIEVKEGIYKQAPLEMEIRGRGNSTWGMDKKPYRIKMSQRTSVLGLKKIKNYVLLADYTDKSLLRNYLGHKLSTYLNSFYTLETRHTHVYLNDEYMGVYLMTEQVKDDKEGLVIGVNDNHYLLELEQGEDRIANEGIEDIHWFHEGVNLVIKDPDMDDFEPSEVSSKITYLHNFIKQMSDSFDKENYDEFIDVDNFIDYFIVHEIFKTVDIGYSSVYSVIQNNKLYMGPHWDFDISLGNGDYFNSGPEKYRNRYNPWFNKIIDNEAFKTKYLNRFNVILDEVMPQLLIDLDWAYEGLKDAAALNFNRWQILGHYVWPNPEQMARIDTYEGQYLYLKVHLNNRIAWLKNEINTKGYYPYHPE